MSDNPSTMFAASTMLDSKATPNTLGRLMTYMARLPIEFQVLFMRSACRANRDLLKTREAIKWLSSNQAVMI